MSEGQADSLQGLLRQMQNHDYGDPVTLEALLNSVGRRSFGPMILLPGLIVVAPIIGDIPGVPTIFAIVVLLTSIQLLMGAAYFWLPRWLLDRSMPRSRLLKALQWMHKPARFVDRFLHARLTWLVDNGASRYLIASMSLLVSLMLPVMEFIPFSATIGGAALVCFGLALVARDGLLVLLSMLFTGGAVWIILASL